MVNVTLINPNIVMQKGDFFGTGIPYMPITLSYLASFLREAKHNIQVIDAFGETPCKITDVGNYCIQGLSKKEVVERINRDTKYIIISAERLVAHDSIIEIIKEIKKELQEKKIFIIENSQAVTAYSLAKIANEFLNAGADFVVLGEPEYRVDKLIKQIEKGKITNDIDGLIYKKNNRVIAIKKEDFIKNLDDLPFPAWDLFPLENYWELGYSHAPLSNKRYLPLLTSRGCPYICTFCIIPDTNLQKWRARSAENVLEEIEYLAKKFKVYEFHIEDLNPTIRKERIIEICKGIIDRKLNICWKIGSGTKVETLDKNTIEWMAKAGCKYVSISPESGSKEILKSMKKPFEHNFALDMINHMEKLKIFSQACFVLGYPSETKKDLALTKRYIKLLVKKGVDEIALFILTPAPGSEVYGSMKKKPKKLSQLTFSPVWRRDYKFYHSYRIKVYLYFFLWKLIYNPIKLFKMAICLITRRFNTKIEMTLFRVVKIFLMMKFDRKVR